MRDKKTALVFVAKVAISAFILMCTLEALYWPLIMKPGTILPWWKVEWLAMVGLIVGFPVVAIVLAVGLIWSTPPDFLFPTLSIVISIAWSATVYWLIGAFVRRRTKKRLTSQHSQLRGADAPLRG